MNFKNLTTSLLFTTFLVSCTGQPWTPEKEPITRLIAHFSGSITGEGFDQNNERSASVSRLDITRMLPRAYFSHCATPLSSGFDIDECVNRLVAVVQENVDSDMYKGERRARVLQEFPEITEEEFSQIAAMTVPASFMKFENYEIILQPQANYSGIIQYDAIFGHESLRRLKVEVHCYYKTSESAYGGNPMTPEGRLLHVRAGNGLITFGGPSSQDVIPEDVATLARYEAQGITLPNIEIDNCILNNAQILEATASN